MTETGDPQQISATIGSSVIKAVASGLKDCGTPPEPLMARHHLPLSCLKMADRPVSLKGYLGFIEEAAVATGNPDFGLDLSQKVGPETLGAVGFLFFCSLDLESALKSFTHYVEMMQGATRNQLTFQGDTVCYSYHVVDHKIKPMRQDSEFSLGLMYRLMKMMVGSACRPVEVHFAHPAPLSRRRHNQVFGAPVYFEQTANALLVPRGLMKLGNNLVDPRLFPVLEGQLKSLLNERKTISTFADQVRMALVGRGGVRSMTGRLIAAELGVSEATLHRRLRQERLSLRGLVDEKLFAQSSHYLSESRLTITEIAQITGFAEAASFNRAFQRWAGMTPQAFRRTRV